AIKILDSAGGQLAPRRTEAPALEASSERRVDPEDGQARTFEELKKMCAGSYSPQEIQDYWKTCQPVIAAVPGQPSVVPEVLAGPGSSGGAVQPVVEVPAAASSPASYEGDEALPLQLRLLTAWLRELKLSAYAKATADWVEEQGACNLEEVLENLE
ncbi:unnamed protein product, partial [Polarella glacialis]